MLGLPGGTATREELSAAWGRYLASMARPGPAVIVFEDVHWADPALLAFVEQLAATAGAPLLIVVTARPTVYETAPDFASGVTDAVRIDLRPLDDSDTVELVDGLLGSVVPQALHDPILRRSEGNPLYAEELVRLLVDRDLLIRDGGAYALRAGAIIPLPESIHALLASRLDTLPADERLTRRCSRNRRLGVLGRRGSGAGGHGLRRDHERARVARGTRARASSARVVDGR